MRMSVTTRDANPEVMAWDTEFWNVRVGRAQTSQVDQWAVDNAVGCMCLLIPALDQADIHRAEQDGFRLMDVRVRYECETGPRVAVSRGVMPGDVDQLAGIARTAFRGLTRFYADPNFPDERCDDLYEGWFRENVADPNVDVLMIGDGGGPSGFVTVRLGEEASIVLIAVADRVRGRGMGVNLTRAAINHAAESGAQTISVVTQGCNMPSQRAFIRSGFVLSSADVWMHKWYSA